MSLEEAAQKVKISKKSLDDYLMQLRSAKKFGFDFERHSKEKVGVIRSFVRKKKDEERKRITKAVNDANLNRLVDKSKNGKPAPGKKGSTPLDISPATVTDEPMDDNDNVGDDNDLGDNEAEIVCEEIKEDEISPDYQRGRRAKQGFKTKADKAARSLFSNAKK